MILIRNISKYIALLTVLLLVSAQHSGDTLNTGGLKFSSKQVYSGQRTSFKLFDESKRISKEFDLSFNCQIYDPKLFGFVFRVIHFSGKTSNPLMHLLFVPVQGDAGKCAFELHLANTTKTLRFEIDTLRLTNVSFTVKALLKDNLIRITCNDSTRESSFSFPRDMNVNFVFGLYGENTDVAPMILQNVKLDLNNQLNYLWPLNELSGNIAHEKLNSLQSEVTNPNWMQDKHYYWEKIYSVRSDPMAGIVMDNNNRILILNKDSLVIYDPVAQSSHTASYITPRPFDRDAFFAVYNPKENVVVGYDFHFLKVKDGRKLYSVFNPDSNSWTLPDSAEIQDQNHHHSIFWNIDTTRLITFGGYSYFHYYNTFRAFDFSTGLWEELGLKGDEIYPRTHTSVNRNRYTGEYYVFGGFGNKEGSQSLEGKYFYDLYKINPESRTIKRVWDIDSPGFDFVPRGAIIFRPDVTKAYVLGSKPVEKSTLRLYEINLEEPGIKAVSDSIPVIFSDMSGNAFLFHNRIQNQLYCVTRETTNQSYAAVSIYRLIFPPAEIVKPENHSERNYLALYIGLIALFFILVTFYFIRKKRSGPPEDPVSAEVPEKFERIKSNSIWLLNEFKVFDKNGHDITYRFPTKIKHAFIVLILENYFNEGILSAEFSDILWPSLNKTQQKNNRGVLINNLRKIFEDLDGVNICKDGLYWKTTFSEQIYIDFFEALKLIKDHKNDHAGEMIMNYFSLGNLLTHETWEYLDQFKDRYSETAIDVLMEMERKAFQSQNYLQCIEISDIILNHYDFLNEPAMIYKIKSLYILKNNARALSEFNKFKTKYNESISKSYHLTFDEVLNLPGNFEHHLR